MCKTKTLVEIDKDEGYGDHYLCKKCSGNLEACMCGWCSSCERATSYKSWKYCNVCAEAKDCCNKCGKPRTKKTAPKKDTKKSGKKK
mgnify:CR=1 FL=1